MKLPRRQFLHLAAGAAALPAVSRFAWAQAYPSRPITMLVGYGVGGPSDTIARIVAERMKSALGQPIVVENVTGPAGSIGVGRLARAAPDGYTIGLGDWSTHCVNAAMYNLPYDVVKHNAPHAARCLISTTSSTSSPPRSWASFPKARTCCTPPISSRLTGGLAKIV
jgi:tripartite-type tricarboxylate transporter receptor subunit TctC